MGELRVPQPGEWYAQARFFKHFSGGAALGGLPELKMSAG